MKNRDRLPVEREVLANDFGLLFSEPTYPLQLKISLFVRGNLRKAAVVADII